MALDALGALAGVAKAIYGQCELMSEASSEGKLLYQRIGDLTHTLDRRNEDTQDGAAAAHLIPEGSPWVVRVRDLLQDCQRFVSKALLKQNKKLTKFLLAKKNTGRVNRPAISGSCGLPLLNCYLTFAFATACFFWVETLIVIRSSSSLFSLSFSVGLIPFTSQCRRLVSLNLRLDRTVQGLQTAMLDKVSEKQDIAIGFLSAFQKRARQQKERDKRREQKQKVARKELRQLRAQMSAQTNLLHNFNSLFSGTSGGMGGKRQFSPASIPAEFVELAKHEFGSPDPPSEPPSPITSRYSESGDDSGDSMSDSTSLMTFNLSLNASESSSYESIEGEEMEDNEADVALLPNDAVIEWGTISGLEGDDKLRVGQGRYASIYAGQCGPEQVVVKLFQSQEECSYRTINQFFAAAPVALTARHTNIAMILGVTVTPAHNAIGIVMERLHLSLSEFLHDVAFCEQDRSLQLRIGFLCDIAKALRYLHFRCIIHGDIKSSNCLLDQQLRSCKIADFTLSRLATHFTTGNLPLPVYPAPELLSQTLHAPSNESDVFSFAFLCHETISAQVLFKGGSTEVIQRLIGEHDRPDVELATAEFRKLGFDAVGMNAISLMERCWDDHPVARPAFDEVVPILQHISSSMSKSSMADRSNAAPGTKQPLSVARTTRRVSPATNELASRGIALLFGLDVDRSMRDGQRLLLKAAKKGHQAARAECALFGRLVDPDGNVVSGSLEDMPQHAFSLFSTASEDGDANATARLGFCFEHGIGTTADPDKALELYERAAEDNAVIGMFYFAKLLARDLESDVSSSMSGDSWKHRALTLLKSHLEPTGVTVSAHRKTQNFTVARKWLKRATEQGHIDSLVLLARVLLRLATCMSPHKAIKLQREAVGLFEKALEAHKNPTAMTGLAKLLLFGQGVRQDIARARMLFESASSSDHNDDEAAANAFCYLGVLSANGMCKDLPKKGAVEYFRRAADLGSRRAQFEMAQRFEHGGEGVKKNFSKAVEYLYRAADGDHCDAQVRLGICTLFGKGVAQDSEQAVRWFSRAASHGESSSAEALSYLGLCYSHGIGVQKHEERSKQFYELAMDMGYAPAAYNLGRMLQAEENLEDDVESSPSAFLSERQLGSRATRMFDAFERASELGSDAAQMELGKLLLTGHGTQQDICRALQCFKKASREDRTESYWYVALCKLQQRASSIDARTKLWVDAVSWCEKAARAGHDAAQVQLAEWYASGLQAPSGHVVIQRSMRRALRWYRAAASQGDSDAQFAIGRYLLVRRRNKDLQQAVRYFHEAASEGQPPEEMNADSVHSDAASALGFCFMKGLGCEHNLESARRWFELAARGGSSTASEHLSVLLLRDSFSSNCSVDDGRRQASLASAARAGILLVQSAKSGSVDSMALLASCFEQGIGVNQDAIWASYWRQQCFKRGRQPIASSDMLAFLETHLARTDD